MESTDAVANDLARISSGVDESIWDHDIAGFLWHEFSDDLSLEADTKVADNVLSMQVKACTPSIKRYE